MRESAGTHSQGLSDLSAGPPASRQCSFLGARVPGVSGSLSIGSRSGLVQRSLERGARLCGREQTLVWVLDRVAVCYLSVHISLRITGYVVPIPLLTGKVPQLCL